jgi:glutaredoxin-like YruB-family protein
MAVAADTVTVYTTSTCPWCVRAKDFLKQKGVPFQEKNLEHDPAAARELMQRTGQMGVPVITAGDEVIVGFDRARLEQLATKFAPPKPTNTAPPPRVGLRVKNGSGGAEVDVVHDGLPAAEAGLRVGDILTEINGRAVRSAADLEAVLADLTAGQTVAVDLRRGGRRTRLRMAL